METQDFGRLVWITDPSEGFVSARITDIAQDGLTLDTSSGQVHRAYEETFAAEEPPVKAVEDNCALMHLNEATLLNNCRLRYADGKIYSYVANILISINPYQPIEELYSTDTIRAYRGKSLGQKEPHIFAIADKAYRELRRHQTSQSIVVSGESGAGKTESQKAVLRYLCENWGTSAGPIQQRLLETNPILEAFGNAKTLRNNNSSRFGKFVQIHFAENGSVAGGFIQHYLLETSRVCHQASGERNYHIFYQLIAGSSEELFQHLALAPPHTFNYLKNGSHAFFTHPDQPSSRVPAIRTSESVFSKDAMVDDFSDFDRLQKSLSASGITTDDQHFIWSTVAGLLHLGNVEFEESVGDSRGGCRVAPPSEPHLEHAARLLGLETEEMKLGLCARIMQATKGGVKGTLIRVPLKASDAAAGRDALAKAIYSKLFDWLVARVNQSIPCEKSAGYIGVLDVAGFEFFAVNSFEQFCINFCNEKLQNFFNERILKQEQELYETEGLGVEKIAFADNVDCIELFETKANGLFDLLDEEAKLPRATFQHFTQRAHEANKKSFRLDTPRKSKVKAHREMRDDEGLLIRHYAGSVCYETKHFVEKNNDQLHNSLEILIEQSSFPLVVSLFTDSAPALPSSKTGGKLKTQTVGAKFKSQLAALLDKLNQTGTHFVRCVKPNNQMKPWTFDGAAILSQLQCAGMASVLRLMQEGFPSRTSFADLYSTYQPRLPPNLARLDARLFSKCLFRAVGLEDYKFGLTRVFFRAGKFAEFDQLMRQEPETMMELIGKVNGWLVKARWRKLQYGAWSVVKCRRKIEYRADAARKIQAWIRGVLVRKAFLQRLALFRKVLDLLEQSKEINEILQRLNADSQAKWNASAAATTADLEELVGKIKTCTNQQLLEASNQYEECVKKVDTMIGDLKAQAENDEMAEVERRRREAEEKARREAEEKAHAEREKERRRKMEEERERLQKEYEAQLAAQLEQEAKDREEAKQAAARAEQERLDSLVSSRLATSDGVQLVEQSTPVKSSAKQLSKYDLTNWKYGDLRDVINTSDDKDLLVACKEEFHRRLRTYNEWKSRNSTTKAAPRAPSEVFSQVAAPILPTVPLIPTTTTVATYSPPINRFFKVSFASGGKDKKTGSAQSGMWYAHFTGRYISRQITIRPQMAPQLLSAGKDDLKMCELPLENTGLLRKKGAEISEQEFEAQWAHYGGGAKQAIGKK